MAISRPRGVARWMALGLLAGALGGCSTVSSWFSSDTKPKPKELGANPGLLAVHQAWTANVWSMVMDYTPKHMMGTVFGFGGMCAAIGGMFMTQFVGYVLTVTNNNYTLLFTMIPAMYVIALVWMYFMAPRKIPQV